ncbi:MAG: mercuric transport protein [Candidatus Eisenbacteria bacterium]|nr:mercuric transport protein [Candidatus Eisenbacteria bacterium]
MKERAAFWGSLVTGLLASACCIGPLLLGAVGLGSLGFAAALAPLRPWFLGLTVALLATGFWLAYRPQRGEACAADGACARPPGRRA